jgi:hypothetical protein
MLIVWVISRLGWLFHMHMMPYTWGDPVLVLSLEQPFQVHMMPYMWGDPVGSELKATVQHAHDAIYVGVPSWFGA